MHARIRKSLVNRSMYDIIIENKHYTHMLTHFQTLMWAGQGTGLKMTIFFFLGHQLMTIVEPQKH